MAARFWVTGGTGNWSSTTNWSATTGGSSGASVPGSADTATFNASSGAGTATVDSSVTIQTLTMTGFTGTLAFGTNTISLNSTGNVFTGATTFTVTGTPVINVTSVGSTAITVNTTAMTEANSISFNFKGGTYALTFLGTASYAAKNIDFTGYAGTWAATSTATIYGNLTLSTGMTLTTSASAMTFGATSGTKTITSNAKTIDFPLTFNGVGGTFQLQDALTMGASRALSLTNGTLDGNNKTISGALSFAMATGSAGIANVSTSLAFTHTSGTLTQSGSNSLGVYTFTAGTLSLSSYTLTVPSFSSSNANTRTIAFGTGNIICNAAGGTLWTTATVTGLTITGTPIVNISNSGAVATTVASGILTEANSISFNFTAGTYALTFLATASYSAKNVNFTGYAGTWGVTSTATVYGSFTLSTGMTLTTSASAMTFGATSGTQTITSNAKTIDFPVTFNGIGGTFQLIDAMTVGSTRTTTLSNGTLNLNGKTLTTGFFNSNNSSTRTLAFGAGNIICLGAGGTLWTTANVTGMTVTGTPVVNISYSGAVATTVSSGALSEANSISFNFTAGTYALTFLASTSYVAKNVNFTGYAGTLAATGVGVIYGNLTLSTGMTLTASNSIMTFGATSGTQTITSNAQTIDFPVTFDGIGGTFQLIDAMIVSSARNTVLTNGTLDLNGKTLTIGYFVSNNSNTRAIAFGTGNIICSGSFGGTFFNVSFGTGLTVTGTPVVNITYSGATASTIQSGNSTLEANAISFNVTTGSYDITWTGNILNLIFSTAFTGTVNYSGTIFGNLTLSSAQSTPNPFNAIFGSTSGTKTITSNGTAISGSVNFNGIGGTWQLQDSLTSSSSNTLTNGTINLNGKTFTASGFSTATGTKNITFNGASLVVPTGNFNNNVPTGFTTTAGTGVGKISMADALSKTFTGGGSTFNCTLSNDGAGSLAISGSNTFTTITNGVKPTSFIFTAGTTQTVTNWTVSGTAGNLVTITSDTAGVPALLSKASGTVSSNYLSLKDSTATGGAAWYAGANSTNVSGNLGWIFTAPPAANTGNFFFMF